jgi:hypothetical protein
VTHKERLLQNHRVYRIPDETVAKPKGNVEAGAA